MPKIFGYNAKTPSITGFVTKEIKIVIKEKSIILYYQVLLNKFYQQQFFLC